MPTPSSVLGPKPADIKGWEWKQVGAEWKLHDASGTPAEQLVKPWVPGKEPTLSDKYVLGADLAKHGLVPVAPGVMKGHGFKFVKDSSGEWHKVMAEGQAYTAPIPVKPKAATVDGGHWDSTYLGPAPSDHPSGYKRMPYEALIERSKEDRKALTEEQRSGVVAYSGSMYSPINGSFTSKGLRNPPPSAEAKRAIEKIDKAFANKKARAREDHILFRGSGGKDFFNKFEVGGVFDDKGFVSTSMTTENGFYRGGDVRFHISVPKGHPVIHMGTSDMSNHSNEREVLLPRDSKFRVLKKEMLDGKLYLHVEVMPHDS
jgi:hypothetical protein